MIATEDILFIMPRDREMQFPAMAALQMYVNNYQAKMMANTVTKEMPDYRFRYEVQMPDEDWHFFHRLGIELKQAPEKIGFPDSVIEMTDERLRSLYNSERHCGQACAAIAGVECPPFPKVKQIGCGEWSGALFSFHILRQMLPEYLPPDVRITPTDVDRVMQWQEVDGTSVLTPILLGVQSYETYAVAAMGLPLIEILPKGRSKNWLSKWKSPLYRIIEEDCLDRLPSVLSNMESTMKALRDLKCSKASAQASFQAAADKASETPTAAGE